MAEVAEKFGEAAAVLWLAKVIVENLFDGKLKAWLVDVGLADDTERLRTAVEIVEMVVSAVKGRSTGSNPVSRSVRRLKELLYDAEDVVDELDYYRIRHEVEGAISACGYETRVTDRDRDGADQVDGLRDRGDIPRITARKRRSEIWNDFVIIQYGEGRKPLKAKCNYCGKELMCDSSNGTSALRNHCKSVGCKRKRSNSDRELNPSSDTDGTSMGTEVGIGNFGTDGTSMGTEVGIGNFGSNQRMRTDEVSIYKAAASTYTWDKTAISTRIQQIALQLQEAQRTLSFFLNFSAASNHENTTPTPCLNTSCFIQNKVYGRSAEKESIISLMTAKRSETLTVVPIVGIAGVGKTTLAQLVYSDQLVENLFDIRIWVCVSNDFDEVRLTREMLDFVAQERQDGVSSFSKLQEMLKRYVNRMRFMLILDDVCDAIDRYRWNRLLAPFNSVSAIGTVILVTTRSLSIAKMVGTVEPFKIGSLRNNEFWSLFKAFAFGDVSYECHPSLVVIGREIVHRLKGNPLAAQTVGMLLRKDLSIDHWIHVLVNESWKHSGGIMPALKLSYDRLPYHLHQCISFCSIFPNNYRFTGEELVRFWISQGFVKCNHSVQRMEDVGLDYLAGLVNLGFFEQIEKSEYTSGNKSRIVMHDILHDFARQVSRSECATIDGSEFNKLPPTVLHLSVVTNSAYRKDQLGNVLRNKSFEEKLLSVVSSVRKLRTLVLIGKYDSFFFQSFQDTFQKAECLRLLQISATYADFKSFMCNLKNYLHLRYLKLENKEDDGGLPLFLDKFHHLQALDIGQAAVSCGMNNLVSMRHLVVKKVANFANQNATCFGIRQLRSMNELVQLHIYELGNINKDEACGANLKDKQYLEELGLSWKEDSYNDPSSELYSDAARDVLDALEPHHNLKHLRISGYNGATSPSWLATSVQFLQTLHLEHCGEWKVLPSLERLLFLRKLKLRNMRKLVEVSIPSLEELVLVNLPILEKFYCSSMRCLMSSLRVLKIERCHGLTLNGSKEIFAGFTSLQNLSLVECLLLSLVSEDDQAKGRLLLPQSLGKLNIAGSVTKLQPCFLGIETRLKKLKVSNSPEFKYLQLYSCTTLEELILEECQFLTSIVGLQSLRRLRYLQIHACQGLPPCLDRLSKQGYELCPRLEKLKIDDLHILNTSFCMRLTSLQRLELCTKGKEVTRLIDEQERALQLLTSLQELRLWDCQSLIDLPGSLHKLPSLKRLEIDSCLHISRLPEQGLPPSLEEVDIFHCTKDLTDQCRMLATSKLSVKIDGEYVKSSLGDLSNYFYQDSRFDCIPLQDMHVPVVL